MTGVFTRDDAQEQTDLTHQTEQSETHVKIAIVGTGFSGLGMAIKLKQQGENDFLLLERADDIGGTWRDNTYPGCACDIPSHLYSFSFALNPNWSHMYSRQPEIQAYLQRCTERFGILPHIRWNNELLQADWHDDDQRWHITTTQDKYIAHFLVLGNGPLSEPSLPAIPGIERFEGTIFHSAQWRHDVDLTGKRVAVIGTGASAVQFVPQIQPQVGHLDLFLRTPPWILPRLDHPISAWKKSMFRLLPFTQRLARGRIYWRNELTALAFVYRPNGTKQAMKLAREHLERQVADPVLRQKLTPAYMLGCKRILISKDFYPALTRPNVSVISENIQEIRPHSVVTGDDVEHEADVIICGTGFHITNARLPQRVCGHNGQSLADRWQTGLSAYLGTTVAGFPNMFLLIGPNTGLGHNSMVYMIESQLSYILDCLHMMEQRDIASIEIQPGVQKAFDAEMQKRMNGTVWTSGCSSWYLDARGHNTTIWPGFTFEFRHRTRHFDPQYYNLVTQTSGIVS